MKLIRIIIIFFVIYLVRRFYKAYVELKKVQQLQEAELKRRDEEGKEANVDNSKVVDADYKVIDR